MTAKKPATQRGLAGGLPPVLHDDLDPIYIALQVTCFFAKPLSRAARTKLAAAMPKPLRFLVTWGETYVHTISDERPHADVQAAYPEPRTADDDDDDDDDDDERETSDAQWDAFGADAARWIATCHATAPVVFAMSSTELPHPDFAAAFARAEAALDDAILPDLTGRFAREVESGKARQLLHTVALRVAGYALTGFVTSGETLDPAKLSPRRRAVVRELATVARGFARGDARACWDDDVLEPLGDA